MKRMAIIVAAIVISACAPVGTPRYSETLYATPRNGQANNQVPITGDSNPIYANVCHLRIFRSWLGVISRRPKTGSAVLYRGEYLLTAAHNLYNPWYNPVERVEVRCGVTNADGPAPDQVVRGLRGATARGYRWGLFNADQFQFDFAVLHLNGPIATSAPISLASATAPVGSPAELVGYPGGDIANGFLLHRARGTVVGRERNVIRYDIESATGNSGGPVWIVAGGSPRLIGIHVTNSGARAVNADFVQEVDRMIAELEER
jgi:V8-like Glu-specific endopeptidase